MAIDIHVLLVDDEAVDLEWLRRRVTGNERLASVQTAPSGFAALKLLETQRIDIILSDIRMPIMSGMEFARKAKEIHPNVHIVFITGHEDFGYAKEAIQLSASGYLLKPVEDRELETTLIGLCEKIEQEREQHISWTEKMTLVNEELLLRWFNEAAPGEVEAHIRGVLQPLLANGTAVAMIEIDDIALKMRQSAEEERRAVMQSAAYFIRKFAHDHHMGMVMTTYDHHFVVLAAVQESYFTSLLNEMIRSFHTEFSFSITIGMGVYTHELGKLHDSYRQAQAALSIKWILGKNRLIQDAWEWRPKEKIASNLEEIVDRMLQAMLEYNLTVIDDCLMQLFTGDIRKNDIYDLIIRITSKLHADLRQMNEHLYEMLNWDAHQPFVLFQFETVQDIVSWLRRRFFELSELLYLKRQRQKRKLIADITDYVKERLDQKITLNEVAAHFSFTPNYLGHLFKLATDSLFSDFLTELRMKRVCELLEDPTRKVYEIAEQVGYKNIVYFNRQFKQSMGMSPGEYRKKRNI
ncbi:response regulator [Paenibacillus silvisoli]|uniref:response regulator n=1 Tax=Paenibacillus silvisoli TaxID=3110539 RepID=UPI0028063E71|nr:response regulator [Paenibacillus silvisoli]